MPLYIQQWHLKAWWEAPLFSFDVPNQAEEWKIYYTRAIDFLDTLDIDPDSEDETKHGWQQIKIGPMNPSYWPGEKVH